MALLNFEPGPLVPTNSRLVVALLILSSCISSATLGYDGSMMSGLNILPAYESYFALTPATTALNTATVYIGQVIPCFFYGQVSDALGRKNAMAIAAVVTIVAVVLQTAAQNVAMFAVSRIIIGIGNGATSIAGYVGGLIASGITNGDQTDAATLVEFKSISDTLKWEKECGEMTVKEIVRTPSRRKRLMLAISVAVFSMLSGNNIVSYYLGTMLDGAGVTDTTTQLEINIIMNAWCLCIALLGTYFMDKLGRKTMAIISTTLLTVFLFLYAGLNKLYGTSSNTSGIYASVAVIFLFQGSYSFGWTPLTVLYPPEVLNYSMRANGMAVYTFVVNCVGLFVTMVFPFAMDAIAWKTYIINSSWDVLELLYLIWAWVETRGKTLEEIDAIFDGHKHTEVPDVEQILHGTATVPGSVIEGIEPSNGSVDDVEEVGISLGKGKDGK
ncbi:hexose transporter [Neofusicoccum parvum]|uniref:Hexose transporter n=2 Tax=Neofusicoccum parvum TaxID=310453 RepID=A0ACB5RRC5_9PEZI|nr:putative hexose transporter protein [Neofusicoccum parvum UCRNP2]GME23068.1 hexose transporter [Neofusicoccum parvum]GME50992.1 hexose transporter [Neofusicoccum parvum]